MMTSFSNVIKFGLSQEEADEWAKKDLEDSDLTFLDIGIEAASVMKTPLPDFQIKNTDGTVETQNLSVWVEAWYPIPYWDAEGNPIPGHFTKKLKFKDGAPEEALKHKYIRPSKARAGNNALLPYLHPARPPLGAIWIIDVHEGEKKAACAAKHGQRSAGIGGCHSGIDPASDKHRRKPLPQIVAEIEAVRAQLPEGIERPLVRIWPDGDLRLNNDVRRGYTRLIAALRPLDVDIKVMDLSVFKAEGDDNIPKFDNLVKAKGYDAVMFEVEEFPLDLLGEDGEALARDYGLLTDGYGSKENPRALAQPILENVVTLMEKHPHFLDSETGKSMMWLDRDRNRPMWGDSVMVENVDDTEVTRYFQRQLGFNGRGRVVSAETISAGIANRLAVNQRSPFEERVLRAVEVLKAGGPEAVQRAMDKLDTWVLRLLYAPDTPFNRLWGRKLLMAIVGRAFRPGCYLRTAFALVGPQDVGKTYFLNSIVGRENVGLIRAENAAGKDIAMSYTACLVAVHDEMGSMSARRSQNVKSDISATADLVRLPFGRVMVLLERRCVPFIPVDNAAFLPADSAGMTRFAVLDLLTEGAVKKGQRFDFAGLKAEADELLAAAWIAMDGGEPFDVVEGAEASALLHLQDDELAERVEDEISELYAREKGGGFWELIGLVKGEYQKRTIVGFKSTKLIDHLNSKRCQFKPAAIPSVLKKLGFLYSGNDKEPLGHKRLWYMPLEEFSPRFGRGR